LVSSGTKNRQRLLEGISPTLSSRPYWKENWLTAEEGQALWQAPDSQRLKRQRDRALLDQQSMIALALSRIPALGTAVLEGLPTIRE
jgi:hypothetical protein